MGDVFLLCAECGEPTSAELAHDFHDPSRCDRALNGFCRCDGVVCPKCCPDPACTPLQEACAEAREDTRRRAEVWESAQSVPASTEAGTVPPHPYAEFIEAMG